MSIATQLWENRKQSRKRHLQANGALGGTRKRPIKDNSKSNQRELSRRGELFGRSAGYLMGRAAGFPDGGYPDCEHPDGCRSCEWHGLIRSSSWSTSTIRCWTTTGYSKI